MNIYLIFICWWAFGIMGAAIAYYALPGTRVMTQGGAIMCVLAGLFGVLCWVAAAVWWLLALGDGEKTRRISAWWNTPL